MNSKNFALGLLLVASTAMFYATPTTNVAKAVAKTGMSLTKKIVLGTATITTVCATGYIAKTAHDENFNTTATLQRFSKDFTAAQDVISRLITPKK